MGFQYLGQFALGMMCVTVIPMGSASGFANECKVDILLKVAQARFESLRDRPGIVPIDAFSIVFRNAGSNSVVLVEPGDGSWSTAPWRRTPIVYWEVERDSTFVPASVMDGGGCGNRNALEAKEVFELLPGESRVLGGWIPQISVANGSYRVRFHYINVPGFRWTGGPLGQDDVAAMEKVRRSASCDLVSNIVEITVGPAPRETDRNGP